MTPVPLAQSPELLNVQLTSSFSTGPVVQIPTLPFKMVFAIQVFPRVTVLLPLPIASAPMTTSLVASTTHALVLDPRYTELFEFVLAVVQSARYLHTFQPRARLPLPVVFP